MATPRLATYSIGGVTRYGAVTDAGIVDLPGGLRYVICLMTDESPHWKYPVDHPGAILNGRLSRLVFDAWWPRDVAPAD